MVRAAWYIFLAAIVLVGLPWALIHFVGWPLPTAVPDGATLRDWFDNPFAPTRFWKAVAVVGWLLWAVLVFFVVTEVVGQLGRVRLPRIRMVRPLQGLAAGMVGATATALAGTAAHAAALPAATAVAAVPDLDLGAAATGPVASDPFYDVEHGDWLSTVAARFLGDPNAYPRIQALNPELEARDPRFPNHIEQGWRLRLPADARDRGIRLHAAGHLVPPVPAQPTTPTPPTVPEQTAPPDITAPATADPPTPTATAAPPATGTSGAPAVDAAQLGEDDDGHPDVIVGPSGTGAMAGAGLLASLLFAMLTAERRRQRGFFAAGQEPPLPRSGKAERELRAARQPADVERLDAALRDLGHAMEGRRKVPDIIGVRLVGGDVHVLLAAPDDDPPPPWLDEGTQWALPAYVEPAATDHPATLIPLLVTIGSRAGRHLLVDLERLGTLSVAGHAYKARDLLRHVVCELACSAWSGDATIVLAGFGDEGETLAEIGPDRIEIAASPIDAAATVRAELAHRARTASLAAPMVLVVANPDAAARTALAGLHQELIAAGRCGIAVVTTVPEGTAFGAAMLTVTDAGLLKTDLPGLSMSTDAASVPVDMLDPMAQVFRAARLTAPAAPPPAPPHLPPWDDTVDPAQGVLSLFDPTTLEPEDPATSSHGNGQRPETAHIPTPRVPVGARLLSADPALDDDLAAWRAADPSRPRIAILGPIQVHLPGELTDSKRRLYTEILLYLLTRSSRSADRAQIEDALWYGNPAGDGTVRVAISRIRRWLGPRTDGAQWISEGNGPDQAYGLRDGVLLDWHLLLRLRDRGEQRGEDGITDYQAALELVRGVPMRDMVDKGNYRRPYTWIGDSDINPGRVIPAITDIAHRVADHHLANGDATTARWAVGQAWLADPDRGYYDLWHDRMRAEHLDGRTAALERLGREYLEARGFEVLEELPTHDYNIVYPLLPSAA